MSLPNPKRDNIRTLYSAWCAGDREEDHTVREHGGDDDPRAALRLAPHPPRGRPGAEEVVGLLHEHRQLSSVARRLYQVLRVDRIGQWMLQLNS